MSFDGQSQTDQIVASLYEKRMLSLGCANRRQSNRRAVVVVQIRRGRVHAAVEAVRNEGTGRKSLALNAQSVSARRLGLG